MLRLIFYLSAKQHIINKISTTITKIKAETSQRLVNTIIVNTFALNFLLNS